METSPELLLIGMLVLLFGAGCGGWVIYQSSQRATLLPLDDRRPVPWGGGATLLIILLSFLVSLAAVFLVNPSAAATSNPAITTAPELAAPDLIDTSATQQEVGSQTTYDPDRFSLFLVLDSILKLGLCAAVSAMLILASRATIADLGLSTRLLSHDVGLGVFSFGAILIPLGVLNLVLNYLIHPQNEHAILEMLQDGTAPTHVWLASVLTAAIVAPLVEEFLFRGIVQGFLEKVFGPLSWTPILISSTFFAAVHINGDSPAPIPLFFFALVLGYLYRQTHRLWPCIVLHMCLNGTSLAIMWFFAGNPELVNTSFILNWF